MSYLKQIAYFQNRRDEAPNQELARELAATRHQKGIEEIAQHLWDANPNIQSDCLKVLYEIGYLEPELITTYVDDFLKLLRSKNNRLVWGSMIALSTIAALQADTLFPHVEMIQRIIESGSVITRDSGVKVLAAVASVNATYRKALFPQLLKHLETCRPKDVPQRAESIVIAVNAECKDDFIHTLETRLTDMSGAQITRLKKVMRAAEQRTALAGGNHV